MLKDFCINWWRGFLGGYLGEVGSPPEPAEYVEPIDPDVYREIGDPTGCLEVILATVIVNNVDRVDEPAYKKQFICWGRDAFDVEFEAMVDAGWLLTLTSYQRFVLEEIAR